MLITITNALMIAVMSRTLGAQLIGPSLVAATIATLVRSPHVTSVARVLTCTSILVLALLVPTLGEHFGLLARTLLFDGNHIVIRSLALDVHPSLELMLVGYAILLASYVAIIVWSASRAQRAAGDPIRLHVWRLRQLVPTT